MYKTIIILSIKLDAYLNTLDQITIQKEAQKANQEIARCTSSHDSHQTYRTILEATKLDEQYKYHCE
jgi:hypothetical protein